MKKRAAALCTMIAMLAALLSACFNDPIQPQDAADGDLLVNVMTDKARYNPGDTVHFTLTLNEAGQKGEIVVQYKHLNRVIEEKKMKRDGTTEVKWDWNPPEDDYKGYMTEIYFRQGSKILDHANIAVDISTDWGKFPRYGYLADYHAMEQSEREAVINRLNRFHINGIQFYDWQWKHHIPLKMENGKPAGAWKEIANRDVSFETVKGYIDLAHQKNMKAMNYNLLFGAYEDAEKDGVKREWGAFRDPLATNFDKHPLPSSWASDIILMEPSNPEWLAYLFEQEKIAFEHLPFDGWHVDQLGDRGSLWNHKAEKIDLAKSYVTFLQEAKKTIDVDYVMNAVGQFAQAYIAQMPVKFLYTEVWDGHPNYKSLKQIIDQNQMYSKGKLNTVLAAYMNYDHANAPGEFNTPGVLLTNSVIFAAGGSHLELGENMLAKEYFPNNNLEIPGELENQLISYYDFLTAYQNLLRDDAQEAELEITADSGIALSSEAEKGKVWALSKEKAGNHILHFINFTDAVHMRWNDGDATQREPVLKENVKLTIETVRKVERIWMASPDFYNGSSLTLEFTQKDGRLEFTLPKLKYWDMAVIEYADK